MLPLVYLVIIQEGLVKDFLPVLLKHFTVPEALLSHSQLLETPKAFLKLFARQYIFSNYVP